MDCKITSIKRQNRRSLAFTLVEVMVSIGIGTIIFLALGSLSLYSGRSFAALANYADLDNASRNALDVMTRDVRQTIELTSFTPNSLTFRDYDSNVLRYVYNSDRRTLTRMRLNEVTVLLQECDALRFSIFQRNPVGGTYDQYPTGTPATTKLIQVSWVCSRTILGARANTESVQTAKIVIRKQ